MYLEKMFTVLFIITTNGLNAIKAYTVEECRVIKTSVQCCVINGPPTDPDTIDDVRKCFEDIPKTDTQNCDIDICVAQTKGYVTPENQINKEVLDEEVAYSFDHIPTLLKPVKENCVYGDLSRFGSACEFILTRRCIHLHMIAFCPEWKSDEMCEYRQTRALKCVEEMDNYTQADMDKFWGN
ncbi:uncharacterized protein LOC113226415 [Hyposmocoma kahamanoa]|uniref:uncharacterized protein LOC113226415 n=1 Tax=Hyposmocoma kahamanoa TaxID=1477025 RepID=UPI000E6D706A|nr:uncharacterized protein LOC113226415 [Hyposmocoma kahamanoa]